MFLLGGLARSGVIRAGISLSDAGFQRKAKWLNFFLIEEGSQARFVIAWSGRLHHEKDEVLPERAVALCLAGATPDAWKRVFRASRKSFFHASWP